MKILQKYEVFYFKFSNYYLYTTLNKQDSYINDKNRAELRSLFFVYWRLQERFRSICEEKIMSAKKIATQFFDAYRAQNIDRMRSLFAEDAVIQYVPFGKAGIVTPCLVRQQNPVET